LSWELWGLRLRYRQEVRAITTATENVAFVRTADVVRYVRHATGRYHDEDLGAIIGAILCEPFDLKARRKRHKAALRASAVREKEAREAAQRPDLDASFDNDADTDETLA
jgi:hypothetical protein